MTMELIQARKLIKAYIKHMEDCPEKECLDKIQKQLKLYVNNCNDLILSIHNNGDYWTIKNEISGHYTSAKLKYDILKEVYIINYDRFTSVGDAVQYFEVSIPSKVLYTDSDFNKLIYNGYAKAFYNPSLWKIK